MTQVSIPRTFSCALTVLLAFAAAPMAGGSVALAQYDGRGGYEERGEGRGLFGGLFGGQEQPRYEAPRHAQMNAPDLAVRLERLENQIRQLTGAIEQLQHRNQQLEQQVRRNQEDVEYRFQEAGQQGSPRRSQSPAPPSAQPPAPAAAPVAPPPARRSDVFDPSQNPGAPGAPQTLGSVYSRSSGPPPPIMAEETPGADPVGRDPGAPLDLGTLADRAIQDPALDAPAGRPQHAGAGPDREPRVVPGPLPAPPPRYAAAASMPAQHQRTAAATPRDELALAQGYIQRREYAQAEESLRAFLKSNPSGGLAPDAHYWLGESLFQRRQFRDAAESFLTVSTRYEKSTRAPDALLRLGQSLAAMGEREAACATLNEVGRKYPRASNARQSAEREQKRVRC